MSTQFSLLTTGYLRRLGGGREERTLAVGPMLAIPGGRAPAKKP